MRIKSLFTLVLVAATALARAQSELPINQPLFVTVLLPDVKKALKVTPEQDKKIADILSGIIQEQEGGRIAIMLTGSTDIGELEKSVLGVLDDKQKSRTQELWLQLAGYLGLEREEHRKAVGLTDDQAKQFDAVADEFRETMRAFFMEVHGDGEEVKIDTKKMKSIREASNAKIAKFLTEEQTAKWKSMLGEKFEFKEEGGG